MRKAPSLKNDIDRSVTRIFGKQDHVDEESSQME
jgi:hypothetical protein